jgi:chromosomal replication initiation ATPase DnaA
MNAYIYANLTTYAQNQFLFSLGRRANNSNFILEVVSNYFNLMPKQLKSADRRRIYSDARHIYCYLACMYSNEGLRVIGEKINRDHASTIHGRNKIAKLISVNDPITIDINKLHEILKG